MSDSTSAPLIAKILIDGPSELVFDYAIPPGVPAQAGCRVAIPLRNRNASGTILALEKPAEANFKIKPITSLLSPEPLLTTGLLRLARWVANYYGAPLEHVIRTFLPTSIRQENTKAKTVRIAHLTHPQPDATTQEKIEALEKRAPRQHLILTILGSAPDHCMSVKDLGGASISGALKSLEKAELITLKQKETLRNPDAGESFLPTTPLQPNSEQEVALEAIKASLDSTQEITTDTPAPKPILLHGVTGSGKTEVYLQATQHALEMGKSVIVLVPEIALTPQTVRRFKSRFAHLLEDDKNGVAVLHSHLSQGERFDEWHRLRKGQARIAIGARSAVFAPLPDVGLIIVDEEHENTYKQDTTPKYNGRDLAIVRASIEKCTVLLGSATPALETYHNAITGKYELLQLKQRVDSQSLPLIRILDMRTQPRPENGAPPIISNQLRNSIDKKLAQKEQVILFLNRRGFARSLQCPACGDPVECKHCSIPLTYHRKEERLICHICGHQAIVPRKCPACGDKSIHFQGYGTEKVEGILHKLFPTANVARLDADTARRKNALKNTLNDFRAHKIDILLGTQMIAKGLDFPNVTLVGVLNADLSLHAPDFRAGERTFSLLTQVAGRAGRGELEGEVIIQTFTPHSPSIQFARHHDYEGFADQELEFRKNFQHPPYSHAALLMARSTHERRAEFTLETLHRRLCNGQPEGLLIGDPIPSPLVRSHSQFRYQLLLRSPSARLLTQHTQNILAQTPTSEDVQITYDLDAQDFS